MHPLRLLLAEDDALIAADLTACLLAAGHQVVGMAARGDDVVRLATALRPHAVLLNVRLRGPLDGLAVAHRLRGLVPAVAICFLTAQLDAPTLPRLWAAGAIAVLGKPLVGNHLCEALETALLPLG